MISSNSYSSPFRASLEAHTYDDIYSTEKDFDQMRISTDVSHRKGGQISHLDTAMRGCSRSTAHRSHNQKSPISRDDDDCSVFTTTTSTSTGRPRHLSSLFIHSSTHLHIDALHQSIFMFSIFQINQQSSLFKRTVGLESRPSKTPKKYRLEVLKDIKTKK